MSYLIVLLWCYYFLKSAAIWELCRGVLCCNAVRHVPLFSGKRQKPSCMSTHERWKGARSKQANTTSIKHYNSLRQQASPAGGLLTPSSHGCQCSDESMIAWPPASLLPRMCSGLLPRHHGCSDESMLAWPLTPLGTIRVRFEVSHRPPLS